MVTSGRGCTDVLCLLIFGVFWAGMAFVGYTALQEGEPQKILYALDSFGNHCGMVNIRPDGTVIDLTNAKKLYYLDPLELLDPSNFYYARSVCVEECPTTANVCGSGDVPCVRPEQYICPYYAFSQFGADGADDLGIGTPASTSWWANLTSVDSTQCVDSNLLSSIPSSVADAMGTTDSCGQYYQTTSMFPGEGPCAAVLFPTTEFVHRCYPVIPEDAFSSIASVDAGGLAAGLSAVPNEEITAVVDRITAVADGGWSAYVTDAQRGYTIVLVAGPVAALIFSLLYMIALRFLAGVVAWSVVILINVLFLALTGLAAYKSELLGSIAVLDDVNDAFAATGNTLEGNYKQGVKVLTYILAVITVICLLGTLLMIRRIKIAVATLKVAAAAVGTMPSILFFPLITFISFLALFVYWVIIFAYQWSAGTVVETLRDTTTAASTYTLSSFFNDASGNVTLPAASALQTAAVPPTPPGERPPCYEDPDCYYSIDFSAQQQYFFAYHLFGLLWTNQFIIGFGYVVIAHCIGQYYWTRGLRAQMTALPVVTGMYTAARYHLGSIAFGSFIVAVIQFVRLLLEYMNRKTKRMQQGNPAAKWAMCCVRYCLWYLEKIMKFINRNAYIIVAVKGYTYCGAALRAMKLIVLNVGRLVAINIIGDALIFLGKLTIVLACGCIAFLMTSITRFSDPTSDNYLSSPVIPVLLSCLASYIVASVFFAVYEMAVDTILLSFCEDCMSHNETPQFAPKLLMSALGKASAFKKQQDERAQKRVADGGGPKTDK